MVAHALRSASSAAAAAILILCCAPSPLPAAVAHPNTRGGGGYHGDPDDVMEVHEYPPGYGHGRSNPLPPDAAKWHDRCGAEIVTEEKTREVERRLQEYRRRRRKRRELGKEKVSNKGKSWWLGPAAAAEKGEEESRNSGEEEEESRDSGEEEEEESRDSGEEEEESRDSDEEDESGNGGGNGNNKDKNKGGNGKKKGNKKEDNAGDQWVDTSFTSPTEPYYGDQGVDTSFTSSTEPYYGDQGVDTSTASSTEPYYGDQGVDTSTASSTEPYYGDQGVDTSTASSTEPYYGDQGVDTSTTSSTELYYGGIAMRTNVNVEARTIDVPIHFHIIEPDNADITTLDHTYTPVLDADIDAQMNVLKNSFEGRNTVTCSFAADVGLPDAAGEAAVTPFNFTLASVNRVTNTLWYTVMLKKGAFVDEIEMEMQRALRKGVGCLELNVYVKWTGEDDFGWVRSPWECLSDASGHAMEQDGIVLSRTVMPNGGKTFFDEGDTLTHEVGHWLGLYHPFHNGCKEPGDMVDDTPYQKGPVLDCRKYGEITCQNQGGGVDPLTNFMSFTQDCCLFQFTQGQVERMVDVWDVYRLGVDGEAVST